MGAHHVLGGRHWRAPAARRLRPARPHRDARHGPLRDHGDQARPRGHAWLPPRDLGRVDADLRLAADHALLLLQETGAGNESSFFSLAKPQTIDAEAGDIAGIGWVRYDDPETKAFKLNAERQNGRAAMLGITGCLLHELLGVDPLYPTGGLDGAAPPTIF